MEDSPILEMEPPARREVLAVLQTLQKDQYDKWVEAKKLVDDAKVDIERAKAEAREQLKKDAQKLIEQAKDELIAIRQQARIDGFNEGLAKAAGVAAEWQKIAGALSDFARDYQANISKCATHLAEYAVCRHLGEEASFVDKYFSGWLRRFAGDSRCRGLSVHPEMLERVRAVLQRMPDPLPNLPLQANPSLSPSDIVMDVGAAGSFELRLRAELTQIAVS